MNPSSDAWRDWRRRAKGRLPYVRRRVHEQLEDRFETLVAALHGRVPRATDAALQVAKPVPDGLAGDVCLFVTHAAQPHPKAHVLRHLEHLSRAGVSVVLVVNSDLPFEDLRFAPALDACSAMLLRANQGLDFAAWAHAWALSRRSGWDRLYLVNDSIVGPLFPRAFEQMLQRIRASDCDHLGLTWNTQPVRHLQSYFLVFNQRLLHSDLFGRLMGGVFGFPEKSQVIDCYETRLTGTLLAAGFRCDSVFPRFPGGLGDAEHLLMELPQLERLGFPYAKTSLLKRFRDDPRTEAILRRGGSDGRL